MQTQQSRPQSINDDDIYVIDLSTRSILEHHGNRSIAAIAMRSGAKWGVLPGQALVTGIKARSLLGARA